MKVPGNCIITFREPYPHHSRHIYIVKACIDDMPESDLEIEQDDQKEIVDYILEVDRKLTSAVVRCDSQKRFVVLQHSPQSDFFDMVEGA